jgi:hypothetical protein
MHKAKPYHILPVILIGEDDDILCSAIHTWHVLDGYEYYENSVNLHNNKNESDYVIPTSIF